MRLKTKINTKNISFKKSKTKHNSKWYDLECRSIKKRLRNLANILNKNPNNQVARTNWFKIKKEYRKIIRDKKQSFEQESIDKLITSINEPKVFWKHAKSISGKIGGNNSNNILASKWVEHFSALSKKDPSQLYPDNPNVINIKNQIKDVINEPSTKSILDKHFTINEILDGIKKLKAGKASAHDIVSNDLIKATATTIAPILCDLFNFIITHEYVPVFWGIGMIIPLYKSGEISDTNNYRGITINSCISKLFTLIMNIRLNDYVESHNILHYNQIGFRKGFRPADHVFTLKTMIDQAFNDKEELFVCFVDFKKAYDLVWRDGLFYKLLETGFSSKFVKVMMSMYESLSSCVFLPNGLSQTFTSHVGLKQGCNLSPTLFNLFINDFISSIKDDPKSPKLGNILINCLFYADDLVLIANSKEDLQNLVNKLYDFSTKWFLEVNTTKTKSLVFSRKRKNKSEVNILFGNNPLPQCDSYCYLGTISLIQISN